VARQLNNLLDASLRDTQGLLSLDAVGKPL